MGSQRHVSITRDPPANPVDDGPDGSIGLSFRKSTRSGMVVVSRIVEGRAAHRSGEVAVGDVVCEVDDQDVSGMPLPDVIRLIKGSPGVAVKLLLERASSPASTSEPSSPTTPKASPVVSPVKSKPRSVKWLPPSPVLKGGDQAQDSKRDQVEGRDTAVAATGELVMIDDRMSELVTVQIGRRGTLNEESPDDEAVGIGLVFVRSSDGVFYVTGGMPGSPAMDLLRRGQINAGDSINAVDGCPVTGRSTPEVVKLIKGKAGEAVSLTLRRGGEAELKLVRILEHDQTPPSPASPIIGAVEQKTVARQLREPDTPTDADEMTHIDTNIYIHPWSHATKHTTSETKNVQASKTAVKTEDPFFEVCHTQASKVASAPSLGFRENENGQATKVASAPVPKDISPNRAGSITPIQLPSPSEDSQSMSFLSLTPTPNPTPTNMHDLSQSKQHHGLEPKPDLGIPPTSTSMYSAVGVVSDGHVAPRGSTNTEQQVDPHGMSSDRANSAQADAAKARLKDVVIQELASEVSGKDVVIQELASVVNGKDAMIQELASSINGKDVVIQELASETEALRAARDQALAYAKKLEKDKSELEALVRESGASEVHVRFALEQQLEEAHRNAAREQASIKAHARSHMDDIIAENSALQSKVAVLQKEIVALHERAPSVYASPAQKLLAEARAAAEGGWEVHHMLHAEKESNRFLGQSLQELQVRHEIEIGRLKEELGSRAEMHKMQAGLCSREEQVRSLAWTLSQRDEEIARLKDGRVALERERDVLRKERDDAQQELDRVREDLKVLQSSQQLIQQDLSRLTRERNSSVDRQREAQAEASDLQYRVAALESWAPTTRPPTAKRHIPTPQKYTPTSHGHVESVHAQENSERSKAWPLSSPSAADAAPTQATSKILMRAHNDAEVEQATFEKYNSLRRASQLASPAVVMAASEGMSPYERRVHAGAFSSPATSATPQGGMMGSMYRSSLSPVQFPVNGTLQHSLHPGSPRLGSEEPSHGAPSLGGGSPPQLGASPRGGLSQGGSPKSLRGKGEGSYLAEGINGVNGATGWDEGQADLTPLLRRSAAGASSPSSLRRKRPPIVIPSPVDFGGKTSDLSKSMDHQNLVMDLARAEHRSASVKKELLAAMEAAEKCVNDLTPSLQ